MISIRRATALGLFVFGGAAITAAIPTASGSVASRAVGKPVIGKAMAVPSKPVAGRPFAVSFKVTRRDTGARVLTGRMICDPSIGGKVIRHVESFRAGTARSSFRVPADATNKLLKVKVTIVAAGGSATRVTGFPDRGSPGDPDGVDRRCIGAGRERRD